MVESVEQNANINSYLTQFEDSSQFCEAYVDDLLDCLGVAHEQDYALLGEYDL